MPERLDEVAVESNCPDTDFVAKRSGARIVARFAMLVAGVQTGTDTEFLRHVRPFRKRDYQG
jgi:hypothetical protein